MKIKPKNRRWILHYFRNGGGHEGFRDPWERSEDGVSAVQAFAIFEATGKRCPCKDDAIDRLTAGKKIHGMNVDMWAEDWANGLLCAAEVKEYCNEVDGMYEEVYKTKWRKYA